MKVTRHIQKIFAIVLIAVSVSSLIFLWPTDMEVRASEAHSDKPQPKTVAKIPINEDEPDDQLIARLRGKKTPEAFLRWVVISKKSWRECRSVMEAEIPSNSVASTFSHLVVTISSEDLSQLPAALAVITDPMERERVVSETFSLCASLNLEHFVREAKLKLEGSMRTKALYSAIPLMLDANDVNSAIAITIQLPPSEFREKIKADIATRWARTAPEDALKWATNQLDQTELKSIELGVVRGFAHTMELERAFSLADMLKTPDAKKSFIGTVAGRLTKQNAETAAKWIEMLPPEWKGVAESKYIAVLSQSDIPRATEVALSTKNNVIRLQAFDGIARNLSRESQSKSSKWIESIPHELGARVIPIFIDELLRTDYSSAGKWLSTISKVELREKGYAITVERLKSVNQVEARKIAEMIAEPTLRSKAFSALERAK